ncbi:MAG: DUF4249 domain-containing protein [Flavobacteriales bacterium]|nr:DUF4249 domain-containing protein [Flavobacteriales bacterium]
MELQILSARPSLLIAAMGLLLAGCDKEINVDLPETESKVVVEGNIETGQAPIVFLTRTQSFFAPTSVASIAGTYISDAVVTVNDGDSTYTLTRLCSDLIPDSLIDEVAAQTGVSADLLRAARICAWTFLNNELLGEEGRTYSLRVETEGKTLTSVTTIPHGVALDSAWFKLDDPSPNADDSLGFLWARLSDPDTAGNAYRWFARRINLGADGQPKDSRFISPFFGVFEDRYIDGLTLDFNYNRGNEPYSQAEDDINEERGYFKRGDTVVVKFSSIGLNEFRFFNSFANNASSQGDVFSNPSNIRSNIDGGLGAWVGYAPRFRTVVCQP